MMKVTSVSFVLIAAELLEEIQIKPVKIVTRRETDRKNYYGATRPGLVQWQI
jgi:hypothetical protein